MRVIAGTAKGRQLKSPTSIGTRPIIDRVKTALFDILSDQVVDATVLDLFGGVGSVGIESLSRGAKHATFIELDGKIATIIRENLRLTQLAAAGEVIQGDAFHYLTTIAATNRRFDIIYVAPPQYQGLAAQALHQIDAVPLITSDGLVIVQIHPKERIDVTEDPLQHLQLVDERRYGSTLLMFYALDQAVDMTRSSHTEE